jgi:hypothetical protein
MNPADWKRGLTYSQQDIWAAFRRRRQILSFYKVTRDCTTLDFWELVDRAVYLLGQWKKRTADPTYNDGLTILQRCGRSWKSFPHASKNMIVAYRR